jgi:hypothetical protein
MEYTKAMELESLNAPFWRHWRAAMWLASCAGLCVGLCFPVESLLWRIVVAALAWTTIRLFCCYTAAWYEYRCFAPLYAEGTSPELAAASARLRAKRRIKKPLQLSVGGLIGAAVLVLLMAAEL